MKSLAVVLVCVLATTTCSPEDFVQFDETEITMGMGEVREIVFSVRGGDADSKWFVESRKPDLVTVSGVQLATGRASFNATAHFIGNAEIAIRRVIDGRAENSSEHLSVIIIRTLTDFDKVFNCVIGVLVFLLYVSFGAALQIDVVRKIAKRPVAPAIGLFTQFVIMPLLSFALGCLYFPDNLELRLGLLFTGVSPPGGLSNIFTIALNGNLDLSLAMTTISNICALSTMPIWIFTLGRIIFSEHNFAIPYLRIMAVSVLPAVPLAAGILMKRYFSERTERLLRALKPVALFLLVVLIGFSLWTSSYIYKLFSVQILLAGLSLPSSGYMFGWLLAKTMQQTPSDAITIAIETGIQNIGVAILLLTFSLPQPQADLTSVMPITCGLMSPIPLLVLMCVLNAFKKAKKEQIEPEAEAFKCSKTEVS